MEMVSPARKKRQCVPGRALSAGSLRSWLPPTPTKKWYAEPRMTSCATSLRSDSSRPHGWPAGDVPSKARALGGLPAPAPAAALPSTASRACSHLVYCSSSALEPALEPVLAPLATTEEGGSVTVAVAAAAAAAAATIAVQAGTPAARPHRTFSSSPGALPGASASCSSTRASVESSGAAPPPATSGSALCAPSGDVRARLARPPVPTAAAATPSGRRFAPCAASAAAGGSSASMSLSSGGSSGAMARRAPSLERTRKRPFARREIFALLVRYAPPNAGAPRARTHARWAPTTWLSPRTGRLQEIRFIGE
mmetsp:Transcript_3965/g.12398  ORF Transcript_3965/g.12398 Transcript_3965/m.12398 type:complete len:310 (-) Transcript_3965:25-954(-)